MSQRNRTQASALAGGEDEVVYEKALLTVLTFCSVIQEPHAAVAETVANHLRGKPHARLGVPNSGPGRGRLVTVLSDFAIGLFQVRLQSSLVEFLYFGA